LIVDEDEGDVSAAAFLAYSHLGIGMSTSEGFQTINSSGHGTINVLTCILTALCDGTLLNLKNLYLSNNRISNDAMIMFSDSIVARGRLSKLECLFLDCNRIGDSGMSAFLESLQCNEGRTAKLLKLNLSQNDVGDHGMRALSEAIRTESFETLVILDLNENIIGDDGVRSSHLLFPVYILHTWNICILMKTKSATMAGMPSDAQS